MEDDAVGRPEKGRCGWTGSYGFGRLTRDARSATPANVVVVGAGLAGLTCAHRLKQAGYVARCTRRRIASADAVGPTWLFATGQLSEHGGELIDQGHRRSGSSHRSWA